MRWFGLSLMMVCAVLVGCEQPMGDTVPSAPSSSSGTSDDSGEIAAPPAVAPADVSPAAETPAVEAPAAETPAPAAETPAPAAETPAPAAETPAPAAETPAPAAETPAPAAETPAPAAEEPKKDETSATSTSDKVRFVANTSLKVPGMMCPFSCWPKVKETLAAQPGVEGVQLAEQAKENEIDNPVVELKVKDGFDSDAAIAALKKASFEDAVVIK